MGLSSCRIRFRRYLGSNFSIPVASQGVLTQRIIKSSLLCVMLPRPLLKRISWVAMLILWTILVVISDSLTPLRVVTWVVNLSLIFCCIKKCFSSLSWVSRVDHDFYPTVVAQGAVTVTQTRNLVYYYHQLCMISIESVSIFWVS